MNKVTKIFIEVSRKCRKNCDYCYNTYKTGKDIKPDIERIKNSIISIAKSDKCPNLIFSGGEPVNSLDRIEDIVLSLRKLGYKPSLTLITNTERLSNELLNFINEFRPYLVLSFNKRTNFLLENLSKLYTKKNIFIRFTITPKNLRFIYRDIKEITNNKFFVGVSPAYGVEWDDDSIGRLKELYLNLLKLKNIDFIYDFRKILESDSKNSKICPSLKRKNAIDIFGNMFNCHRAIYFPLLDIRQSKFKKSCRLCPAYKFCTPCIYKEIPGNGCKIRVAISSVYEILYFIRRSMMRKKLKITYKGKKYEIPETIIKKYSKIKKSNSNKKNLRNFYELGESDCY